MEQITLLGATGSIGASTLDVLTMHPDRYQVYALTANTCWQQLACQVRQCQPRYAVLADPEAAESLRQELAGSGCETEVLAGEQALVDVASAADVDTVVAAIVGAAGLLPSFAAVEAGKKILLANKEVLVMAGGLFMAEARRSGAQILPIDSEHNAIFQCLPLQKALSAGCELADLGVNNILLTASGGPFRDTPLEELASVTPAQACAHPNWDMGQKISVDSATMMNKGLELIEACWLFNCTCDDIEVLIHPQSVVHSMVTYVDGSVLAQLGNPDMRTPIAHALAWPARIESGVPALDVVAAARLDFSAPDYQRFPCLALAQQAASMGQTAPAVLNAANEVAVAAFLQGTLAFTDIAEVIRQVLLTAQLTELVDLETVQLADAQARQQAWRVIDQIMGAESSSAREALTDK